MLEKIFSRFLAFIYTTLLTNSILFSIFLPDSVWIKPIEGYLSLTETVAEDYVERKKKKEEDVFANIFFATKID